MFTRNQSLVLAAAALVAGAGILGCEKSPDPEEFGEIIYEVPPELNQPFPLPELERPEEEPPADEPQPVEPASENAPATPEEVTK